MSTKIRKDQIRIEEFIQAMNSVNWSSDVLTASAAAIASKIQSEVAGVAGAMLYRGAWSTAATDTIKKGYVYVYAGSGNGSIGTGSAAITLEPGDLLIANRDRASVSTPDHWTIVNVNITGAVTEANLATQLLSKLASGNANALSIAAGTGANAGKVVLTVNFPTVTSMGIGSVVTGISIDATTGGITVTKDDVGDMNLTDIVTEESLTPGSNMTTAHLANPNHFALYINGVRQKKGTDFTLSLENGSQQGVYVTKVTMSSGAYVPTTGDVVTCDYVKGDSRQYE